MTRRFFYEPQPGHVAHTAASALLVTQPDFVDFLGHQLEDTLPAVASLSKTIDKYGNSTEPNQSAVNVAFGTDENPMSFIASGKVSGPRFAGSMRWVGKTGSFDDRHIVENYPWEEFGEGVVVDVLTLLLLLLLLFFLFYSYSLFTQASYTNITSRSQVEAATYP